MNSDHRRVHTSSLIMSFLNITDPKKRATIVADYLATVKRLQNRNLQERARDLAVQEEIEQSLRPIIQSTASSTEAITNELVPIKEGITALNTKLQKDKKIEEKEEEGKKDEKINILEQLYHQVSYDKLDEYFGIIRTVDNHFMMGDKKVEVEGDDIIVDGTTRYKGTNGLWSLIMFKKPTTDNYTQDDLITYRDLVKQTNVMNSPNNLRPNSKVKLTYKWRKIFPLLKDDNEEMKHGSGIGDVAVEFLPGDINSLRGKLSYLLGEFQAGNTSAILRNEITAIVDNLKRRGHLSKSRYRDINNYIQQH